MFLIRSKTEKDFDEVTPLYWSNEVGWVDRDSATPFPKDVIADTRLVGEWAPEHVGTQEMFEAYVECALWSTNDESTPDGGVPFDYNYGPEDLDPETREQMRGDCADFLWHHADDIGERYKDAGHDFWLSREGHGAGFFDGPWDREVGRRLHRAAKEYGGFSLVLGDDGKIYH